MFKYINDVEASGSTSFILPKKRMGYGIDFVATISSTDVAKQLQLVDEKLINSGLMSTGTLLEHLKNPQSAKVGVQTMETASKVMEGMGQALKVMRSIR